MAKSAAEKMRDYRKRKAAKGLCLTCPQPAAQGRSKCLPCAEKSLEAARKSLRAKAK